MDNQITPTAAAPCWADVAWAAWDAREEAAERHAQAADAAANEATIDALIDIATGGDLEPILEQIPPLETDAPGAPSEFFATAIRTAASGIAGLLTGAAPHDAYAKAGELLAQAIHRAVRVELSRKAQQ